MKNMKNDNIVRAALSDAVARTMENMTFEEVEIVRDEREGALPGHDMLWSSLPIKSPHSGELTVQVSREYGRVLAEEVAGFMDEDIPAGMINDVLAELANTMAGRFMDNLIPADTEFDLGLPTTGTGPLQKYDHQAATIPLRIGDHYMVVSVQGRDFVNLL